ncbi:ras GEF [Meredithblackwellia eburnea MCA 4105]
MSPRLPRGASESPPPPPPPLMHEPEFVRALHDFVPVTGSNTCLSFHAGQVIRTLNKDQSGWWDGELDGKRGWFPSNYVQPLSLAKDDPPSHLASLPMALGASADSALASPRLMRRRPSAPERAFTSTGRLSLETNRVASPTPTASSSTSNPTPRAAPVTRRVSAGSVLASIQQAITLLKNAAQADRVAHFQPSTACVISSVRTVLSSTDCLTRESQVLKLHPSLVHERKRILTSLQALVNEARRASSPASSEQDRQVDTARMLELAVNVEQNVRLFLDVAGRLGVEVSEKNDPSDEEPPSQATIRANGPKTRPDLRPARSMGDLKGGRRPNLRVVPQLPMPRDDSAIVSTPPLASDNSTDSSSSASEPPTPESRPRFVRTPEHLIVLITAIYERLSSIIGNLIGHVHQHSRSAPSTSYAYLIDVTRVSIEYVRDVLVVVEAISRHGVMMRTRGAELAVLGGSREALYVATTALVTAARVATSAPMGDQEEEEKRSLLQAATAVYKAGEDCVVAVKLCIQGFTAPLNLILPDFERSSAPPPDAVYGTELKGLPSPVEEAAEPEGAVGTARGKRGAHTLSMLGRKATSLSCLRDKYQVDGVSAVTEEQEEGERDAEDDEARADAQEYLKDDNEDEALHGRKMSVTSTSDYPSVRNSPPTSRGSRIMGHSRTSSRASSRGENRIGSVPMSRGDSSRTSESAASSRSGTSRTSTNETSPRSSLSATPGTGGIDSKSEPPAVPSIIPLKPGGSVAASIKSGRDSTSSRPDDTPWFLERDYEAREISFNPDGHVTGGTLRCLIERMTLHDTTIEPTFANTFFLTFRMFTSPTELSELLYTRFELAPPAGLRPDELKVWNDSKATPVRLRIYNLFKTWIENHWHPDTDAVIIESLLAFCRGPLATAMPSASQRLVDLVQKRAMAQPASDAPRPRGLHRAISSERLKAGKTLMSGPDPYLNPNPSGPFPPAPVVTRSLLSHLRSSPATSINIADIDPLELARQLTIMESRLYLKIHPEELLGNEFGKKGSVAVNVRAMSTLSTRLTGWIAETILSEQDAKKRAGLLKYFIKLSNQCLLLDNYNTLMAILCALTSSTISRLRKTWDALPAKYRLILDTLRKATEHGRNYAEYRAKIRSAVPPCLPFVGLFLTDLTFCYEGNRAERPSPLDPSLNLINLDRYQVKNEPYRW